MFPCPGGTGTAECGAGAEGWRTRPALALGFQSWGRSMSVAIDGLAGRPRRKVTIRRDAEDYVIVMQPEDVIVFRNPNASALRKACNFPAAPSAYPLGGTDLWAI
jgi:hypothetical protein